jgi:hypothetical protein
MRSDGVLGAEELQLPGGGFSVGDRIVVKRNEPRLDVLSVVTAAASLMSHPCAG